MIKNQIDRMLQSIIEKDGFTIGFKWIQEMEKNLCNQYENLPYTIDSDGEYHLIGEESHQVSEAYHHVVKLYWALQDFKKNKRGH